MTVTIAAALSVAILSPAPDIYVSGLTTLRARVEPADAAVVVSFFVDGRQMCTVAKPPYECERDAGRKIVEHRIRVAAADVTGTEPRTIEPIVTKGVGFAESVDVEL